MHSISKIKQLLALHQTTPTKRFGQNFLIDQNIISKIVESANIKGKDVIEVGPGLGSLSLAILQDAKSLVSYEIDREMINILKKEISNPKFNLIEGDFLKQSFNWNGKKVVVANIPYNITTDIIFKFLENSQKFEQATIMVQKEFGERLLAKVNDANYSKLTISVAIFGQVSKVVNVSASCFFPSPKIDSMVVKIVFNDALYKDEKPFLDFLKNCFAQKRKTLVNNLKNFYHKENIELAIKKIKKTPLVRPQELTLEEMRQLFLFMF